MKNHPLAAFWLVIGLLVLSISALGGTTYRAPGDFDGDGKTDFAIFRPQNGQWWVRRSTDGSHFVVTFGNSADKPVPADYTGDGKADVAIWRPSTGEWFVLRSEDFSYYSIPFGATGDRPVQADYDGDGRTDIAVWRSSNATWYIQKSTGGYGVETFGLPTDYPVPADYDGDGKADISVSRVSTWWLKHSSDGTIFAVSYGNFSNQSGYWTQLFPGDFTGDGKADQAVYTNVTHNWGYRDSATGNSSWFNYDFVDGLIPVPGDYDGDQKLDIATFNLNNYKWTIHYPTGNVEFNWGAGGDVPIPFSLTQSNQ